MSLRQCAALGGVSFSKIQIPETLCVGTQPHSLSDGDGACMLHLVNVSLTLKISLENIKMESQTWSTTSQENFPSFNGFSILA
jgi:hypothetical protein